MKRRHLFPCLLPMLLWWTVSGCEKHPLDKEISLEDAAKMLIDESTIGKSIYGGNLVATDTVDADGLARPTALHGWVAHWDSPVHTYDITYDTVVDRGVPDLRGAIMSIRDSMKVTLDLIIDADSVIRKTNHTTCRTGALLVQLGAYGDAYNGWVLRKIAHRRFRGPGATPSITSVTVQSGDSSWALSEAQFSIDLVPKLSREKSITVRVKTRDATDRAFLNVGDSGTRRRIPMTYHAQSNEFVGGWTVSSAAASKYYQAFVEVYSNTTFTSLTPSDIGVAGQTFVYRIP